jgi:hypothetical protein
MSPPPIDPSAPNPPRTALRTSVLSALAAMTVALAMIGVRMAIDGDFDRAPRLIGTFEIMDASAAVPPGTVAWTLAEREVNNPAAVDRAVRERRAAAEPQRGHFAASPHAASDESDRGARALGFVGDESVLAWLVDALDRADGLVGPTGVAFRAAPGRDEAPRCVVGLVSDGEIAWNADAPGTGLVSVRSVDPRAAAPFDPLPWDRAVWRRTHAADDDGRRVMAAFEVPERFLSPDPWAYRWSCARAMMPEHLRWGGLAALLAFAGTWAYRWRNAASRVGRKAAGAAADLDRFLTAPPEER